MNSKAKSKTSFSRSRRAIRLAFIGVTLPLFLAACSTGSGSSGTISLIPAEIAERTQRDGLFTQPLAWERSKPGCKGDCPTLKVDSLIFPGVPILTELVDHALVTLTQIDQRSAPRYSTLAEYEKHFWQTAGPRDSTVLAARVRYGSKYITSIELDAWQYFTGAAHGIPATQFIVWDNASRKVLGMKDLLVPGGYDRYIETLRRAHADWKNTHPDARDNPQNFDRIWPFQPTDNVALTDQGLLVKYDAYEIAPYSSGQPELLIPYTQLSGILKPQYLPE